MPMGIQQLKAAAMAGDPQAIQMLQELGGGGAPMQNVPPSGGPPPGGAPGMVPPGQGQLSPQGGGAPIPPDVQARRAQDLMRLLRAQGR